MPAKCGPNQYFYLSWRLRNSHAIKHSVGVSGYRPYFKNYNRRRHCDNEQLYVYVLFFKILSVSSCLRRRLISKYFHYSFERCHAYVTIETVTFILASFQACPSLSKRCRKILKERLFVDHAKATKNIWIIFPSVYAVLKRPGIRFIANTFCIMCCSIHGKTLNYDKLKWRWRYELNRSVSTSFRFGVSCFWTCKLEHETQTF